MKIAVFDKLLLDDGQVIRFNILEFALVIRNGKYCIEFSDSFEEAIKHMELPKEQEQELLKARKILAKVKLKCELRKKNGN